MPGRHLRDVAVGIVVKCQQHFGVPAAGPAALSPTEKASGFLYRWFSGRRLDGCSSALDPFGPVLRYTPGSSRSFGCRCRLSRSGACRWVSAVPVARAAGPNSSRDGTETLSTSRATVRSRDGFGPADLPPDACAAPSRHCHGPAHALRHRCPRSWSWVRGRSSTAAVARQRCWPASVDMAGSVGQACFGGHGYSWRSGRRTGLGAIGKSCPRQ